MSDLAKREWAKVPRRALTPTEIVKRLADRPGWKLSGDGADVAIERTFRFADYFETIAFVNALAFVAHRIDHHPDLSVHYDRCVVRWSTHAVQGISETDFECAALADALLA
ncbi:4a-hydroxytetrahydrobiopterin dehydratase [Ramlibacter ginsenosidimutans]|uniref:Putative pterin-4-alpha-carbinolamine dehydratase n=1 Tax=Ramlibacter ginsenosidimutans TaxID=502333 RepID=A0A934TX58_9BURK|nr:4a-hydroxytetrahydrobiopterin dehydratase [Ramlibacter ginsenosidimutans]MBK6008921.1 4a-hydroxytetrahydrobiopterin dehydratase [Ramlibacter ginsenosidimutans]